MGVADVEVRVLGRPQVTVDGAVAPLTGRQLLLAVRLALVHPVPVPRHRMLADVWPDDTASDGAVRVALTRLRAALGADVVCRVESGYTFSSPTSVDANRFQGLLRWQRHLRPAAAAGDDRRGPGPVAWAAVRGTRPTPVGRVGGDPPPRAARAGDRRALRPPAAHRGPGPDHPGSRVRARPRSDTREPGRVARPRLVPGGPPGRRPRLDRADPNRVARPARARSRSGPAGPGAAHPAPRRRPAGADGCARRDAGRVADRRQPALRSRADDEWAPTRRRTRSSTPPSPTSRDARDRPATRARPARRGADVLALGRRRSASADRRGPPDRARAARRSAPRPLRPRAVRQRHPDRQGGRPDRAHGAARSAPVVRTRADRPAVRGRRARHLHRRVRCRRPTHGRGRATPPSRTDDTERGGVAHRAQPRRIGPRDGPQRGRRVGRSRPRARPGHGAGRPRRSWRSKRGSAPCTAPAASPPSTSCSRSSISPRE